MTSLRFLTMEALPDFLAKLADDGNGRVLVPTKQGKAVIYTPYKEDTEVCFDKSTVSPKAAALPPCETLVAYTYEKDPDDLNKTTLTLDDTPKAEPTIIFGCRPCDARGFVVIDRPYTEGPHTDPYYQARRENLTIITRACTETCSTCFCHWVGSGPIDKRGSDILMTQVEEGLILQGVTEKGTALLEKSSLPLAGEDAKAKVNDSHANAAASLEKAPDIKAAKDSLAARFTDVDFWEKQTAHCLSCGACTYICPTCYCFNITDEGDGICNPPGKRLRTWDNCMAPHFTREASGHNPRTAKALRMRNRISHKFSYYPTVWEDNYSCSGCGRCITQCPVHLDIRSIVLAAINNPTTSPEKPEE